MLCHEGHLWPRVTDEKWSLSHAVSGPRSAARRAAQDLVKKKTKPHVVKKPTDFDLTILSEIIKGGTTVESKG